MVRKKRVVLYVEGGGDSDSLHSECRRGFSAFLEKAGLEKKMPKVVACGSRNDAYDRFCTACSKSDGSVIPVLLVDSEAAVDSSFEPSSGGAIWSPWGHLEARDQWSRPQNASEEQCNLMVECMENWFAADVGALERYYGQGFDARKISAVADIEKINKKNMYAALVEATKDTRTKGKYSKGGHSFEILASIDSSRVIEKSKWAKRFVDYLKNVLERR